MKNLSNVKQKLLLVLSVLMLNGCLADLKNFSSGRSVDSSFETQSVTGNDSPVTVSSSEKRVALVIGNDAYTSIKTLEVAVNDAKAIASTLENLGFEVIYVEDADIKKMGTSLDEFASKAKGSALALFYFAGHGAQYSGENFLIPVDFKFEFSEEDGKRKNGGRNMPKDSLHVNQVLAALEQANIPTRILILDACRNWGEDWGSLNEMKSSAKFGFGTLIVFSTEPGTKAADRIGTDSHSPFAKALLKYMPQSLPVQVMFTKVQNEVHETTKGKLRRLRGNDSGQSPWVTLSPLGDGGDLCLAPCVPTGANSCKIRVGKGLYDGECQNGIPHGQGVLRYNNGEYYQGSFSNGVRHGKGIQYLTDGTEVAGEWMNGRLP